MRISKRASKRGVGKAAVIMDEKTRRGRVGGANERQKWGRAREKEGYAEANRDERGTAQHGTVEQGRAGHGERRARGLPRSATSNERWGAASERQEAAATNRASEPRRSGMESSRENAKLRRESSEPLVAEATWLRSCFIYLRPVASSTQVEFHSWNLNKGGQGFSPGRFIFPRSSPSSALNCAALFFATSQSKKERFW